MKKEDNMKHVNLENAREEEQATAMKRIESRKECPFCLDNLRKEHKEPILKEGDFWLVTKNQWPYEEAKKHFLLISKTHIEKLEQIPEGAGEELIKLIQWIEKEFEINSGGIGIRFGDINFNGGTVSHLHIHLLQPDDSESDNYKPIRFKIG